MAANRIKKGSISGLLVGIVLVVAFVTHLDNSHNTMYVKAANENDKCQELNYENTITNDYEIIADECNRIINGSEKCDSVTSMILSLGNIKCS